MLKIKQVYEPRQRAPTVYLIDRRSILVGRAIGRRDWGGDAGRRLIDAMVGP